VARTVEQIQAELDKVTAENKKNYEALKGTAQVVGGVYKAGGIEQQYETAVNSGDTKTANKLKSQYLAAQKAYKESQDKKNALTKELQDAQKSQSSQKVAGAKSKAAASVYNKALEDLSKAEARMSGYNGTENYVAAYQKAQQAFDDAKAAGIAVPKPLPAQLAPVPPVIKQTAGGTGGTGGTQPEVLDLASYFNTLADPKQKANLIEFQNFLIKNWGYKGKADGKYTLQFQSALADVANNRSQLPASLQGNDFRTFLKDQNKNIFSGTSGTGTKYTPTATVYTKDEAASVIQNTYNALLKRDATAKEINDAYAKINAAQKDPKNAVRQALNKSGVLETTGGVNVTQLVEDIIRGGAEYKGSKQSAIDAARTTLNKTAIANGLDLTKNFGTAADEWAKRIANGEDASVFTNLIRQTAKVGMPDNVAKLLDQGVDLETIYAPYKNVMQSVLEVPANTLNLTDPALRGALSGEKPMTIFDFENSLRKDSRWQYTKNAHDTVTNAVQNVLKDFGFVG
jgi:hypothetical protein